MAEKPTVFIASTHEQLKLAEEFAGEIRKHAIDVIVWDQAFRSNQTNLQALFKVLRKYQFGIVVLSADDMLMGPKPRPVPRDNLIYEIGLFHGRDQNNLQTFLFQSHDDKLERIKMPSDLDGLNSLLKSVDPIRVRSTVECAYEIANDIKDRFSEIRATTLDVHPFFNPSADITYKNKVEFKFTNNGSRPVLLSEVTLDLTAELNPNTNFKTANDGILTLHLPEVFFNKEKKGGPGLDARNAGHMPVVLNPRQTFNGYVAFDPIDREVPELKQIKEDLQKSKQNVLGRLSYRETSIGPEGHSVLRSITF